MESDPDDRCAHPIRVFRLTSDVLLDWREAGDQPAFGLYSLGNVAYGTFQKSLEVQAVVCIEDMGGAVFDGLDELVDDPGSSGLVEDIRSVNFDRALRRVHLGAGPNRSNEVGPIRSNGGIGGDGDLACQSGVVL